MQPHSCDSLYALSRKSRTYIIFFKLLLHAMVYNIATTNDIEKLSRPKFWKPGMWNTYKHTNLKHNLVTLRKQKKFISNLP